MQYHYIIIEDNPSSLAAMQACLAVHATKFKQVGTAHNIEAGMALYFAQKPSLIFLDVELGNQSGFDFLTQIRQHTNEIPLIIMTTAHDKYAKQAVNNDVLYFLDKPVLPTELAIALNKFEKNMLQLQHHIIIKDNKLGYIFIPLQSILYIKSLGNYCQIHTNQHSQPITATNTLSYIETILPNTFLRTQKSYIINTKAISSLNIAKKEIKLHHTNTPIAIGDTYLSKVKNTLLTTQA